MADCSNNPRLGQKHALRIESTVLWYDAFLLDCNL